MLAEDCRAVQPYGPAQRHRAAAGVVAVVADVWEVADEPETPACTGVWVADIWSWPDDRESSGEGVLVRALHSQSGVLVRTQPPVRVIATCHPAWAGRQLDAELVVGARVRRTQAGATCGQAARSTPWRSDFACFAPSAC